MQIPAGLSWQAAADLDSIHQSRLVITNNGDDTLSIASDDSLTQPKLLDTIEVGNNPIELEGPHHLRVSPDGKFIYYNLSNYVTNGGSGPHGAHGTGMVPGYLVKLDARTGRPLAQVQIDRSPGDVILSKDGKIAYVSHYDIARFTQASPNGPAEQGFSDIAIVDTESMQLLSMTAIAPTLHGMGLSPDEKLLYVTCAYSDQLAIIDVSQPSAPVLKDKLYVGKNPGIIVGNPSYAPYALTVAQDGTVWISNNVSGDVSVYDPATGKVDVDHPIKIGGTAMFSTFSTDASKLYVVSQYPDHLFEIVKATRDMRDLPLPPSACLAAHAVSLLPGGSGLVAVCEGDHLKVKGTLVYVDLPTFTISSQLSLGLFSDGVEVMPALP